MTEIATVTDLEEIRRLKARYFRLMDQKRWSELPDVFVEEVRVDTTDDNPNGRYTDRRAFCGMLESLLAEVITVHHGHMPELAITGPDTAIGTWSMTDELEWPEGSPIRHLRGSGWYEEEYARCPDGHWRIAVMKLRRLRVEIDGRRTFPQSS